MRETHGYALLIRAAFGALIGVVTGLCGAFLLRETDPGGALTSIGRYFAGSVSRWPVVCALPFALIGALWMTVALRQSIAWGLIFALSAPVAYSIGLSAAYQLGQLNGLASIAIFEQGALLGALGGGLLLLAGAVCNFMTVRSWLGVVTGTLGLSLLAGFAVKLDTGADVLVALDSEFWAFAVAHSGWQALFFAAYACVFNIEISKSTAERREPSTALREPTA